MLRDQIAQHKPLHMKAEWSLATTTRCFTHHLPLYLYCPWCGHDDPVHFRGPDAVECPYCEHDLTIRRWEWRMPIFEPLIAGFEQAIAAAFAGKAAHPGWAGEISAASFRRLITDLISTFTTEDLSDTHFGLALVERIVRAVLRSDNRTVGTSKRAREAVLAAMLLVLRGAELDYALGISGKELAKTAEFRPFAEILLLGLEAVLAKDLITGSVHQLAVRDLSPVRINPQPQAASDSNGRPDLAQVSDEDWGKARRRFEILQPLLNFPIPPKQMVLEQAARAGVHRTTIYRWLRSYRAEGELSSLLDSKSGPPGGDKKLAPEVEAIVEAAIQNKYLTRDRLSAEQICREVLRKCHEAGLQPPHPNTVSTANAGHLIGKFTLIICASDVLDNGVAEDDVKRLIGKWQASAVTGNPSHYTTKFVPGSGHVEQSDPRGDNIAQYSGVPPTSSIRVCDVTPNSFTNRIIRCRRKCCEIAVAHLMFHVPRRVDHAPNGYQDCSLKHSILQRQESAGAVLRSRMQIPARCRDAGVSECRLHQMDGRPMVECVRCVGMPKPMWRYWRIDASALRGSADDAENGNRLEETAVHALPRAEHGMAHAGRFRSYLKEKLPHGLRQLDRSGDIAFPEHGDLPAVAIWLQIAPGERTQLADPDPGGVQQREDRPVPRIRFQAENAVQLGLGENPFIEPVADGGQPERPADIERQVPEPVSERQERFDG